MYGTGMPVFSSVIGNARNSKNIPVLGVTHVTQETCKVGLKKGTQISQYRHKESFPHYLRSIYGLSAKVKGDTNQDNVKMISSADVDWSMTLWC